MFKKAQPFFILIETPLHAGTGRDLGVVDLPIQRERHTDFPKIEGSGLKGSIREVFEETPGSEKSKKVDFIKNQNEFDIAVHLAFGYDDAGRLSSEVRKFFDKREKQQFSGALGFTDARTLLFPVKSMRGVFAWITCPKVLERFEKDLSLCKGINVENMVAEIAKLNPDECLVCKDSSVTIESNDEEYVILEEYTFKVKENIDKLKALESIGDKRIPEQLVILHNDAFKDFVNLSTEVITRTKIDNKTGTVKKSALFTEEYLPCETILYSLALTTPIFQSDDKNKGMFALTQDEKSKGLTEEQKVMDFFTSVLPEVMQIGGNATIGKGIVRMKILEKTNETTQNHQKSRTD